MSKNNQYLYKGTNEDIKKTDSDENKKLSCPKQEFECYTIHLNRRCHELCIFAAKYHKGSIGSSGTYCGMWWIFHSPVSEHDILIKRYNIDKNDYELIKR